MLLEVFSIDEAPIMQVLEPRFMLILIPGCFFGVGFVLLRYPAFAMRFSRIRNPTARQFKAMRVVGYMGVFGGCLFLLEYAFGLVR
jgi:hypothetical protein